MAWRVILELKRRKIKYVVAPYEADSQMAYLCKAGLADFVISEDSDCIPYGCPNVLFKLDHAGFGMAFKKCELVGCHLNFNNWTHDMIVDMCILSGCDYLPNIKKVGITRAHRLVRKYKSTERVLRSLHFDGTLFIPGDYETSFRRAKLTFRHHRVFDPRSRKIVFLNDLPEDLEEARLVDFLGPSLPDDVARDIADGLVDPISRKPFELSGDNNVGTTNATIVDAVSVTRSSVLGQNARSRSNSTLRSSTANSLFERQRLRTNSTRGKASIRKFFSRNSAESVHALPSSSSRHTANSRDVANGGKMDTIAAAAASATSGDGERKEQVCPNRTGTENSVTRSAAESGVSRFSKYFDSSSSLSASDAKKRPRKHVKSQANSSRDSGTEKALKQVATSARALSSSYVSKRFRPFLGGDDNGKSVSASGLLSRYSFDDVTTRNSSSENVDAVKTRVCIDTSVIAVANETSEETGEDEKIFRSSVKVVPETPEKARFQSKKRPAKRKAFRLSKFTYSATSSPSSVSSVEP
eukprot:g2274.t1